jgi:hypothetical protein
MAQYLPYLAPLFCILFFIGLVWAIGFVTGWRRLAKLYPMTKPLINEKKFYLKSISVSRWGSYNNCVTIGISDQGMSLSQLFFFRIGHSPVFIPWEDLLAEKVLVLKLFPVTRLILVPYPKLHLTLAQSLCNQLANAAGDYWPKIEETV